MANLVQALRYALLFSFCVGLSQCNGISPLLKPLLVQKPDTKEVEVKACNQMTNDLNGNCALWSTIANYCTYNFGGIPLTSLCSSCMSGCGSQPATTLAPCVDSSAYANICPFLQRENLCSSYIVELSSFVNAICPKSCSTCGTAGTTASTASTTLSSSGGGGNGGIPNCPYGTFTDGVICETCGLVPSNAVNDVRIVGGVTANAHSWPAIAEVYFNFKGNIDFTSYGYPVTELVDMTFQCAGTLINRRSIMTAGHCLPVTVPYTLTSYQYQGTSVDIVVAPTDYYSTVAAMYTIYLGAQARNDPNSVMYTCINATRNAGYSDVTLLNDITMLRLSTTVVLNTNIQPACLPIAPTTNPFPAIGAAVYGVGWGLTTENGVVANTLQNVKLTVYDGSYCANIGGASTPKNWASQICAGYLPGGKDTCQGDSGGALYALDTINGVSTYIASGVVSYGDGCAQVNTPGVYTRVSYYMSWIQQTMLNM